jgi:trans-2,3-dihydro-3-hydroxyanthranilate isomerase
LNQKLKFFITDVFGETRYSGNQLATFLSASSLSDREMQQIAREINFSETTYILSDTEKEGGYDVRIFTPAAELDFAGHPTLGTAYIIQKQIIKQPVDRVVLNLKVGQVPVSFSPSESGEVLWMRQVAPAFGKELDPESVARILNLRPGEIDDRLPIEEVSTGLPCVIIPLKSMEALRRVRVDRERYDELTRDSWARVLLTFCPGGYTDTQTLGVRVFPVALGIAEDPATGSGNGCLAAYLVRHRYFGANSLDIRVGQGYEIGRPSDVYIRAVKNDEIFRVEVGGRVIPIAEGWWG